MNDDAPNRSVPARIRTGSEPSGSQSSSTGPREHSGTKSDASGAKLKGSSPGFFEKAIRSQGVVPLRRNAKGFPSSQDRDHQDKQLLKVAAETKSLLSPAAVAKIRKLGSDHGGHEHEAYFDYVNNRWFKITRPGAYGTNHDANEYLLRLQNAQTLFPALDYRVEGIIKADNFPQIVTSMNHFHGVHPELDEIHDYLESKGWSPSYQDPLIWEHPSGAVMHDAHEGNFLQTSDGIMIPIDSHLHITKSQA